jgi:hypothetical protein
MPQPAGPYAERPRRSGKPEGRANLTARNWSSIAVIVELPAMPVPNCTSDPCAAHQAGIKSACVRSTLCDTRKGELRTRGVRTPRKLHLSSWGYGLWPFVRPHGLFVAAAHSSPHPLPHRRLL